jgi:protein gp37
MSKIEWTDRTWNPIIGCSKISPACDHCYAEKMAARLATMPQTADNYGAVVTNREWNGKTALIYSALQKPLHWRKPCRVFVGSMTDLFHPSTPTEWIDKVFAIMALTPHITYQVLTKRPERMREYCVNPQSRILDEMERISGERIWCGGFWPLPNVWLGVTVENQEYADKRLPILLDTPAAVRFVSVEPMLGAVNLRPYLEMNGFICSECGYENLYLNKSEIKTRIRKLGKPYGNEVLPICPDCGADSEWQGWPDTLDWVICGGETGPGARPMHPKWARGLRDQCQAAEVPFFFKQWGKCVDGGNGWTIENRGKGGRLLDGREHHVFPTTD